MEEFRHHVGVCHLQHLWRSLPLLAGPRSEEADRFGGGSRGFYFEDTDECVQGSY